MENRHSEADTAPVLFLSLIVVVGAVLIGANLVGLLSGLWLASKKRPGLGLLVTIAVLPAMLAALTSFR
jgi:hypothetical protein